MTVKDNGKEKRTKTVLEKDIQNDICKYLSDNGFFFWRSNNIPVYGRSTDGKFRFRAMPKYSKKGVPDILCIYKGKFIGLEVKQPKKELSSDQANFSLELASHGGYYYKVTSVEDVMNIPELYIPY